MKLTAAVIREFESDQREYGTRVALHNILWQVAASIFRDLGARRVTVTYRARKNRGRLLWSRV